MRCRLQSAHYETTRRKKRRRIRRQKPNQTQIQRRRGSNKPERETKTGTETIRTSDRCHKDGIVGITEYIEYD
jgi:hypothetical protein